MESYVHTLTYSMLIKFCAYPRAWINIIK